jgi:hypothetical protein
MMGTSREDRSGGCKSPAKFNWLVYRSRAAYCTIWEKIRCEETLGKWMSRQIRSQVCPIP